MKDKLHIILILSLIFILLAILFVVTVLLRPKSFGEHGNYRWDALNDIFSSKVVNQNIITCKKCHNDIFQLHQKDAHYNVPCVDCHGAGDLHVEYYQNKGVDNNITQQQAILPKEYTLEGCLYCHRKLNAKPSDFPQIDPGQHYKFLHVKDSSTKCIECHSPHEPIFLLTEVNQSKLHPIVYKCTDCHITKPEKSYSETSDHPKIFDCKDCHSQIVKSFEQKPHNKYVECRTCHLFHKENESVGRMYKNGNARFCLLCHENKPFKDAKYPPKIDWPSHLGDLRFLVNIDQKICLSCHSDKIHEMDLKGEPNPHAANWRTSHGKFINKNLENKNTVCGYCHKKNFCYSCHKLDMPHPEGFLGDHKDVVKEKGRTVCANCHPKEFCSTCHE